LPDFSFIKFNGVIWRQTAVGMHPLDTQGSFTYGGRFNPPFLFQILYTSLSITGVKAEFLKFTKVRDRNPSVLLPRELHQLGVSLEKVVDLTSSYNRKLLKCSVKDLIRKNWSLTQNIGLQLKGWCDAILTYSAADPNEKNLCLFESGIRQVSVIASSIIEDMSDWDKVTP
jgi:RES domain-containing protein